MHILFHKVVQRRFYGVGYTIMTLLQIVHSVPVKKF